METKRPTRCGDCSAVVARTRFASRYRDDARESCSVRVSCAFARGRLEHDAAPLVSASSGHMSTPQPGNDRSDDHPERTREGIAREIVRVLAVLCEIPQVPNDFRATPCITGRPGGCPTSQVSGGVVRRGTPSPPRPRSALRDAAKQPASRLRAFPMKLGAVHRRGAKSLHGGVRSCVRVRVALAALAA